MTKDFLLRLTEEHYGAAGLPDQYRAVQRCGGHGAAAHAAGGHHIPRCFHEEYCDQLLCLFQLV